MGFLQRLSLLLLSTSILICLAAEDPARLERDAAWSKAYLEIRNVMLQPRGAQPGVPGLIPRTWDESSRAQSESESPLAKVKRALLGRQSFTCDPGYSLCACKWLGSNRTVNHADLNLASNRCCPPGYDRCCTDGTCVKTGERCCSTGGGACAIGLTCCSSTTCAPEGGECCATGQSCDPGLHCVIVRGSQRCCENKDCTGYNFGGGIPSFSITPISIPSLTIPSFTPISFTPISFTPLSLPSLTPLSRPSFAPLSFPSITIPSITVPPLSIPSITIPTPIVPAVGDTVINSYSYYTSTWTYYFTYFFMTTIRITIVTPTSSRDSTEVAFSVYATDRVDANSQFRSITADIPITSAFTAPGYTNKAITATGTSTRSTASPALAAGGGSASTAASGGSSGGTSGGAASGGVTRQAGWGVLVGGSCLGLGIGMLAVWL